MENWQEYIALHHNIEIIDENTIKIPKIAYDLKNNLKYDDVITKIDDGYQVETYENNTNKLDGKHIELSLNSYLGY